MERVRLGGRGFAAWIVVAALGCGGRAATAVSNRGGAPVPPVCVAVEDVGLWQAELFPSCPPPPLPAYPLCDGAACARPCAADSGGRGMHGSTSRTTYAYDADGHVVRATAEDGSAQLTCAWGRGRLEHCSGDGWRAQAIRDERGRLVAIVRTDDGSGEARTAIGRDGDGRSTAVGARELRYRDDGRIVQVGDRTIEYDVAGRIARTVDRHFVEVWSYDEQGRLARIVSERTPSPPADDVPAPAPPADDGGEDGELVLGGELDDESFDPSRRTYAFLYDERGRLTESLNLGAHEDASSGTAFEYDCR